MSIRERLSLKNQQNYHNPKYRYSFCSIVIKSATSLNDWVGILHKVWPKTSFAIDFLRNQTEIFFEIRLSLKKLITIYRYFEIDINFLTDIIYEKKNNISIH